MKTIPGWEFKEEGDLIYLPLDGEGTYEAGTQLPAGQAETQILGREPDLISWAIDGGMRPTCICKVLVSPRWRWTWAESQTLSLIRNQWSTAGTSEGSPVQGNRGGWQPSMHQNGVSPMVVCRREYCAYSAQGRKLFPAVLVVMAVGLEVPPYLLYLPLSLTVGLG